MAATTHHFLQQERERFSRALAQRLQTETNTGRGLELEALLGEINLIRSSIAGSVRQFADQFNKDELIEFQSRLHTALDELSSSVIKNIFETHTQELYDLAQRDPLTSLLNRAAFDFRLVDEVERARRYRREMSLVLFDLDRFKSVNDQFGHPAGDRVLQQVACILQSSLRQSDAAFRHGGDEFAAICPETDGNAMASGLRRLEANISFYFDQIRLPRRIGISWGIASYPDDSTTSEELIRIADERLYICKRNHHQKLAARR